MFGRSPGPAPPLVPPVRAVKIRRMSGHRTSVALSTELFHDDPEGGRLADALRDARHAGAELAVLPELPLDPWCPAGPEPRDGDAEPPEGPRHARIADAARTAGLAVLGGAIVRSTRSGRRYNTALLFDAAGELLASHRKIHLPEEDGFWEARHYSQGTSPPAVVDGLGIPLGILVCSDIQRPQGAHLLAASGAELLLVPRATPAASYPRWLLVLRAIALTAACYVVSVNRPGPEGGVAIGGPSVAIGPDGEVLLETTERLAVVDVDRRTVREARQEYPGYLSARADLYALGWSRLVAEMGGGESPGV